MKLIFITEARFIMLANGNSYSMESSFSYSLFKRYLDFFSEVIIFARTKHGNVDEVILDNLVTKQNVTLIPLPYYVGFSAFLKTYFKLRKSLKSAIEKHVDNTSVIICRVPGRIGATSIEILKRKSIPYGIEVVGDPWEVLSIGSIHPLAPIIKHFSFNSLKKTALNAPAALYVTKHKLQDRYPCNNFNIGVSDVVLPEEAFVKTSSKQISRDVIKLISIGSLDQLYKSPDVVLKSIKLLKEKGITCQLLWIGDGIFKPQMEQLTKDLEISHLVNFIGKLPGGEAIRRELDNSDIFILVSRTEGLPRAMVEAMARALPCIGTNIGGIPELLEKQALVQVNDIQGLTDKIQYYIENKEFAEQQSIRNLEVAHTFEENILNEQRKQFYIYLKNLVN